MCKVHNCQNCGESFDEKPNCANKYCSQKCYFKDRFGNRPWADCSGCLAAIGFGKRTTGQILGIKPGTVLSQRKRDGIVTQTPPIGSWRIWAKRKAAGKNPDKKRTASEIAYERYHMDDIKQAREHGFDWSYEWTKERAKRTAKAKWEAMTPEEKKSHNRRCMANTKKRFAKSPEAHAAHIKYKREWRAENKDALNKYNKQWRKNNPEKMRAHRKRQMENPAFRALRNQRKRFRDIMKSVKNGGTGSYSDKIGCTTAEFHRYMEAKFKPGMTWSNYGTYWHVDHIIPCAAFNQSDPHQLALCWHHSNMQPLEARDNLRKSAKFNEEQLSLPINHTRLIH